MLNHNGDTSKYKDISMHINIGTCLLNKLLYHDIEIDKNLDMNTYFCLFISLQDYIKMMIMMLIIFIHMVYKKIYLVIAIMYTLSSSCRILR